MVYMSNESDEDNLALMIQDIKERLAMGMFRLTRHAAERLRERRMAREDIMFLAKNATKSYLGDDNLFHFVGPNLDDDETRIVCEWEDAVLIITVI